MITGDHARTAARIAESLGIADRPTPDGAVRTLTGPELDALDDASLRDRAQSVSVFARVAPEHKLRIVAALRATGDVVAMTGDGVNDAPALRSADIGVAMGITGTDVAKEAANMILADDNFATIVAAVREGRAIFANIRKFLRYLLSSNTGEVLTMFVGVIGAPVLGLHAAGEAFVPPLLATQILWINLVTDSGPALALGFDPPPEDVMRHPPRRSTDRVIDRAMAATIISTGVAMAAATLLAIDLRLPGGLIPGSGSVDEARTMAFTTSVLASLFVAYSARSATVSAFHRPLSNPRLAGAVALAFALQVLVVYVPFLNVAFSTVPLDIGGWAACAVLASSVLWVEEARKLVARRRARD
jgi:magnesium-transporting ATPase (P-type)